MSVLTFALPVRPEPATPGPWTIVRSFNGFRITRTWSDGWYQVRRTEHLRTVEQAQSALASVTGAQA